MMAKKSFEKGGGSDSYVETVLAQHPAVFGHLLGNAPRFRFQVLLSHLVPGPDTRPRLVRHGYRVDQEYFYPASTIKLCAAVSAVGKLKQLESSIGTNVNCNTPLALYSLFEGTEDDRVDLSNINQNLITVAHEIRKIFLVSDNKAFNRLFSFVGHRTINEAMWDLGLQSTKLHHRLSEFRSIEDNLYSEPFDLDVGGVAVTLLPKYSRLVVHGNSGVPGIKVGTAFITDDHQLVPEPMDFTKKNYMSLADQQHLLIKLVRPDVELETPGIEMDEAMRMLLMEAMSQYPSQSTNPIYDQSAYPDDYCKFFLPGLSRVRSKGALRIYNKIGRAYGFTIENSYIFDIETGRSFFLTAVLYTNANGVLNDDRYEYELADRAMADLAEVLARSLWQIPPSPASLSSPFDCTPSSLWTACSLPLMAPIVCESKTEQVPKLNSPRKANNQEAGVGGIFIDATSDLVIDEQSQIAEQSCNEIPFDIASSDCTMLEKSSEVHSCALHIQLPDTAVNVPNRVVVLPLMTHLSMDDLAPPKDSFAIADIGKPIKDIVRVCYQCFVDE